MKLLHRFVNERYTTYKNTIPLWIYDIDDTIKRMKKTGIRKQKTGIRKQKTKNKNQKLQERKVCIKNDELIMSEEKILGQQLLIFPDLWTMKNSLLNFSSLDEKKYSILHGQSTKKQRSDTFW